MAASKPKDAGASEVQEAFEEEQDKGLRGVEVDPIDNREYSISTGPNSPTAAEQRAALAKREEG